MKPTPNFFLMALKIYLKVQMQKTRFLEQNFQNESMDGYH